MSRRRLLPALSALWLALAGLSWLLIGATETASSALRLLLLAAVGGFGVFVLTGWALVAWERLKPQQAKPDGQAAHLTLEDLLNMDPAEFEDWVRQLFRSRGYFAQDTPNSGDHGVDLWVVSPQGEKAVVQCKRYRGVVGEAVVRDLFGVMQHEGVPRGFLVTTGAVSAAAGRWVQDKPIEVIDGPRLALLAAGHVDPAEPLAGPAKAVDV